MDVWSPKLHLATWTAMNLLCVFSKEVTVRYSDLMLCEKDKQVCVTDLSDCGPRNPSSIQQTLNISCYYQKSDRSMVCEWNEESDSYAESDVSLIFKSEDEILSCQGIFNPAACLDITARIKNYMTGSEIWSQPYTVFLYNAVKPSQPVINVLGSTMDSVDVSWTSSSDGRCRLRYRVNDTHIWTQVPDSLPAHLDQSLTYKIKDLLQFTTYRVAVACREEFGIWSDWSTDVTARTLHKVPSRPPEVWYRVEKNNSAGSFLLHLIRKNLDIRDAGDFILGYQVSYEPVKKQHQDGRILNVTELTAPLVMEEGNYSVIVRAFNMAGYGPATYLSIDTQKHNALPSVRNLWVSSSFPAMKQLHIQWGKPQAPSSAPPVSHFAVQWRPESRQSTSRSTTVDSFSNSAFIQDVDPNESYLISVFPVYNQQCGSPQSLPASLQQGALIEVDELTVVSVTKTTVTVVWAWQRKSGSIRVNRYKVMLRKDSETQTLFLWPDQQQEHTFLNLKPNTEYSLHLLADDVYRNNIPVTTSFDEVPAVAAVTPLLLLAVTVFIIYVLSRTLYKSYFFPPISSPRGSTTGQWLMDPNPQTAERKFLDLEDFQVTDILGEKGLIMVGPKSLQSTEDDLHRETSLLSVSQHIIKTPILTLDKECVSHAPEITEHPLASLQSHHADYAENFDIFKKVFISEESRAAEANGCFPQKDKENRQDDLSMIPHQKETDVKGFFHEFMTDMDKHRALQMTCEAEYMVNDSFLGKTDVETVSRQADFSSYLICETDYIANICLTANTAEEDGTISFSTAC